MSSGVSLACWIVAVAVHGWLLFRFAARTPPPVLLKRAGIAFVAAPACLLAIMLVIFLVRANPSDAFGNRLFSLFFTVEVLVMLVSANTVFHGMVDGVAAFHRRVNAANLDRFPVSVLIRHHRGLKLFGTLAWFEGGALMFYGIWFDMHV